LCHQGDYIAVRRETSSHTSEAEGGYGRYTRRRYIPVAVYRSCRRRPAHERDAGLLLVGSCKGGKWMEENGEAGRKTRPNATRGK